MDWQNERWVKVYTRDSGDILAIGWEGRYVLWELMRKVDRSGILDETDDGVIAEMLRIPHDITERGLAKLAKRKVIQRTDNGVVIPNFLEAQESRSSNKQRQAEFRARNREKALSVTPEGESVTKRNENVTQNNAASHGVTTRVDKKRIDKTRLPEGSAALALAAISKLNALTGRTFSPTAKPTMADATRLVKLGHTPEQAEQVVTAKVVEWFKDDRMVKQLKPSVLLRPSNFAKYLEEDVKAGHGKRQRAGDFGSDGDSQQSEWPEFRAGDFGDAE